MNYFLGKKKRHTVKNQLMVNNHNYIIHKASKHKKGRRHDYDVYKKNHPVIPKQVVNVVDLGYLGIETDFLEQISSHYHIKRKETMSYYKKKKRVQDNE